MAKRLRILFVILSFTFFSFLIYRSVTLQIKKAQAVQGDLSIGSNVTQQLIFNNDSIYNSNLYFGRGAGGKGGTLDNTGKIYIAPTGTNTAVYLDVNARTKTNSVSVGTANAVLPFELAGNARMAGNVGIGNGVVPTLGVPLTVYNSGTAPSLVKLQGADGTVTIGESAGDASIDNNLIVSGTGDSSFAGNVGIGKTNPVQKLDITGNARASGNMYIGTGGGYFYSDTGTRIATPNDFYVQATSTNTYLYSANTYLGGASGDLIHLRDNALDWTGGDGGIIAANGNVGIGTTAPAAKLDINSSATTTSIRMKGTNAGYYKMNQIDAGDGAARLEFVPDAGTAALTLRNSGNVGVGTTAPQDKFQVNGNTIITGSIVVGDSGFDGPMRVYSNSGAGGRNALTLSNGTPVGVGVTKSSVIRFKDNNNTQQIEMGNDRNVNGTHDFYIYDSVSGADRLYVSSNGNIGIGNTTPGHKLSITGTGATFGVDNAATFQAKNAGGAFDTYLWPRWSDNVMYMNYGSAGFNIRNNSSTSTMFMTSGGSVGIGSTAPASKLDVAGGVRFNTVDCMNGYCPTNQVIRLTPNLHLNSGAGNAVIVNWDNGTTGTAMTFRVGNGANADVFDVLANGNVGIGTTAPTNKLQLVGNVAASGWVGAGCEGSCETGGGYALMYADGHTVSSANVQSPIFYDLNDTSYYVDAASTTVLNALNLSNRLVIDGQTVIDDGGGWHRSYGNTGWYNGTYGGGWYMIDTSYVRSYNNKTVYSEYGFYAPQGSLSTSDTSYGDYGINFHGGWGGQVSNPNDGSMSLWWGDGFYCGMCYITLGYDGSTWDNAISMWGGDLNMRGNEIKDASYIFTRAADQHLWVKQSNGTSRFAFRTSDGWGHGYSWVSNWKDLAENMQPGQGQILEPGDLVMADPTNRNHVIKTTGEYLSNVLGVISTKPGLLMNQDVEGKDKRGKPVSLAGRAPMKVTTVNGNINIGDPLTSSPIPGVAMKATKAGRVIGYAMEAFPYNQEIGDTSLDAMDQTPYRTEYEVNGQKVGKVSVFVNPSYIDPDLKLTSTGDFKLNETAQGYELKDKDGTLVTRIASFAKLIVAKIEAGLIETKKLVVNGVDVLKKLNDTETQLKKTQSVVETQELKIQELENRLKKLEK